MLSVCIYLQVHQPYRVGRYSVFDIGERSDYFDDDSDTDTNNEKVFNKVAGKSYKPTNNVLLSLLKRHPEFKLSISFSGIVLEQMETFDPETLASFQELVKTGRVEILAETYYHSLAFFHSRDEFERQVEKHAQIIKRLFNVVPAVFRNTELSYTNTLAQWAEEKGYKAILAEGWDAVLGDRLPTFLYQAPGTTKIKMLLKHYKLSDDIAFRFSDKGWESYPLMAETFADWVHRYHGSGNTVNLFMDYETFGEHQWEDTGIFNFLASMPEKLLADGETIFMTPSEVADTYDTVDTLDIPHVVTWADTERDLTAWTGNEMQQEALKEIYVLEDDILTSNDAALIEDWRRLQTSDQFYYMCTKWSADGDVHAYFSPYDSPYDAYISYQNILEDIKQRINNLRK